MPALLPAAAVVVVMTVPAVLVMAVVVVVPVVVVSMLAVAGHDQLAVFPVHLALGLVPAVALAFVSAAASVRPWM